MARSVRVAAFQALTRREGWPGDFAAQNLADALAAVRDAASRGAQILCFPECHPLRFAGIDPGDALARMQEAARGSRIHLICGGLAPADGGPGGAGGGRWFNNLYLIGPDGALLHTYSRSQPAADDIDRVLFGGLVQPGEAPRVVETGLGRIGMLVCSEIFSPELPRLLALQGCELLFAPVGGMVYELEDAWRVMLRARAIENHLHVITCQNLITPPGNGPERGIASIVTPEGVAAARTDPGLVVATLDLDRLAWLRSHEETLELPKPWGTIPGLLAWRRPALYGPLVRGPGQGMEED